MGPMTRPPLGRTPDDEAGTTPLERRSRRRNRIRYAVLLAGAIVYPFLYGGFFPFALLYLLLAVPAMSLVALVAAGLQLKIGERLSERVFVKGDTASYQLTVGNESLFLLPYVTIRMAVEGQYICSDMRSMRISLPPLSKRDYVYDLPLRYRGRYGIGVRDIVIEDMLGLFCWRLKAGEQKTILVKPRIHPVLLKQVPAATVSQGDVTAGLWDQGNDETVNIREYRHADSLRRIHWKLFAKMSRPMVRDMKNELDNDIVMILNTERQDNPGPDALAREDCIVEEVVSQSAHLVRRSFPVRLCLSREDPVVLRAQAPGDFPIFYDWLSEIKFNQQVDFAASIDRFLETASDKTLVMLFTISLTGAMVDKALAWRNKGFDMEIFWLDVERDGDGNGVLREDIAEILMKSGIRAYPIRMGEQEVTAG